MKNKLLYIIIILLGITTNAQKTLDQTLKKYNKNNVPYISVTELRMYQAQGNTLILDSRELKEFQVSHLDNAVNVGFDQFSLKDFTEKYPDKNLLIVVYCTLGIRSEIIADKLIKAGYKNVKNLYGGICEWKNKDFKVVDSTQIETQNVHTFSKEWSQWLIKGKPVF